MTAPTSTNQPETIIHDGQTVRLPFADLLPNLPDDDFAALKSDIADNGIQVPIIFNRLTIDDLTIYDVVDGQHRFRAAVEQGLTWDAIKKDVRDALTPEQAAALAFDLNVKRRQLTHEQRASAAVALRQAGLSYRAIADKLHTSTETARRAALAAGPDAQPEAVTGADGKQYTTPITERTRTQPVAEAILAVFADTNRALLSIEEIADALPKFESGDRVKAINFLSADHKLSNSGNGSPRIWRLLPDGDGPDPLDDAIVEAVASGPQTIEQLAKVVRARHTYAPDLPTLITIAQRLIERGLLVLQREHGVSRYTLAPADVPPVIDDLHVTFDQNAITIGTGAWDRGAWHRVIDLARRMVSAGIWDGHAPLVLNEVYDLHTRVFGITRTPITDLVPGQDYQITDDLPADAHPSPDNLVFDFIQQSGTVTLKEIVLSVSARIDGAVGPVVDRLIEAGRIERQPRASDGVKVYTIQAPESAVDTDAPDVLMDDVVMVCAEEIARTLRAGTARRQSLRNQLSQPYASETFTEALHYLIDSNIARQTDKSLMLTEYGHTWIASLDTPISDLPAPISSLTEENGQGDDLPADQVVVLFDGQPMTMRDVVAISDGRSGDGEPTHDPAADIDVEPDEAIAPAPNRLVITTEEKLFYLAHINDAVPDLTADEFAQLPVVTAAVLRSFRGDYAHFTRIYADNKQYPLHLISQALRELIAGRHIHKDHDGWYKRIEPHFEFVLALKTLQDTAKRTQKEAAALPLARLTNEQNAEIARQIDTTLTVLGQMTATLTDMRVQEQALRAS